MPGTRRSRAKAAILATEQQTGQRQLDARRQFNAGIRILARSEEQQARAAARVCPCAATARCQCR